MSVFYPRDTQVVASNQLVVAPDPAQPHVKWNMQVPLDWLYLVTDPEQAHAIDNIAWDLLDSKEISPRSVENLPIPRSLFRRQGLASCQGRLNEYCFQFNYLPSTRMATSLLPLFLA